MELNPTAMLLCSTGEHPQHVHPLKVSLLSGRHAGRLCSLVDMFIRGRIRQEVAC